MTSSEAVGASEPLLDNVSTVSDRQAPVALVKPKVHCIGFLGSKGDVPVRSPFRSGRAAEEWWGRAFSLLFDLEVTPDPGQGMIRFLCQVVTVGWATANSPLVGRGTIVVARYDWNEVSALIDDLLDECAALSEEQMYQRVLTRFALAEDDSGYEDLLGEPLPWDDFRSRSDGVWEDLTAKLRFRPDPSWTTSQSVEAAVARFREDYGQPDGRDCTPTLFKVTRRRFQAWTKEVGERPMLTVFAHPKDEDVFGEFNGTPVACFREGRGTDDSVTIFADAGATSFELPRIT